MLRQRRLIRKTRLLNSRRLHEPHSSLVFSEEMRGHLRWIEQKYQMGQDMILLGLPTSLKRRLVAQIAELNGWDIEYLAITRDTTESDLKQRREIVGNTVVYTDQPPVRAAINGSILILDGIENAERNVLPTLNNLLENREMSLDDGRFLTKPPQNPNDLLGDTNHLVYVHKNFRVIALGLPVPPFSGRSLDPPLRSRFQCRFIDEPTSTNLLSVSESSSVNSEKIQRLINFYENINTLRSTIMSDETNLSGLPVFSSDLYFQCIRLLNTFPELTPFDTISRYIPSINHLQYLLPERFTSSVNIAISTLQSGRASTMPSYQFASSRPAPNDPQMREYQFNSTSNQKEIVLTYFPSLDCSKTFSGQDSTLLPPQAAVLSGMLMDHSIGHHLCLLGPKGCGKSVIAREFAHICGYPSVSVFPLYQELTSRDLLQRRTIAHDGDTTWLDTPLIRAVREGGICVLDGIHTLDVHALFSLRRLLQDGVVNLPNGETLKIASDSTFRVLALGLPPDQFRSTSGKLQDHQLRFITSDMNLAYHHISEGSPDDLMVLLKSLTKKLPSEKSLNLLLSSLRSLHEVAGRTHPELKPSYRHALILSQNLPLKEIDDASLRSNLRISLENTFLIRYLPGVVAELFDVAMAKVGLDVAVLGDSRPHIELSLTETHLTLGDVCVERSVPVNVEKVPRPLFYDNQAHRLALESILRVHTSDKYNSILLIGNQGVGKNKLVDQMLHMLRREREYIQLHRDSTLQSLMMVPTLQDGRVVFEDSPLLIAAKTGRVLVIDEADKAPLEILCLLKMLAEDGELILHDGRRLLSQERIQQEYPDGSHGQDILPINPNFRLIVLANRPGYPFHGNNLFRECGDIFSVQVIENLDLLSEISLLNAYGPDVPSEIIRRIALAFQDLRRMYENHELSYPYSAREAVSVVKHIQSFPEDGVAAAVENILSFEGYNPRSRKTIALVFQSKGIPVPIEPDFLGLPSDYLTKVQSMIKVSQSFPIPEPVSYVLKSHSLNQHPPLTCASTSSNLSVKPWTSNSHTVKSFAVHPARVFQFSEEVGRLYVGDARRLSHHGMCNGMVVDRAKPNVLHVLTSSPLELHSYYPTGTDEAFFSGGGEGKYVTRLLVDPEIQWRLGDPEVIMSPLPQGGVSVFLHEHGLALIVPGSDPDDIQPVLQCQIPPLAQKRSSHASSGFSTGFSEKIQSVKSSLQNVFDGSDDVLMSEPLTLFKQGQSQFHLIDYHSKKIVNVSTSIEIQNISPVLPRDDLSVFKWVVTGKMTENSNRFGHALVSYSTVTSAATLGELSFISSDSPLPHFKDPFDGPAGWNLASRGEWVVEDKAIWSHASTSLHPTSSSAVEWTGSPRTHFAAFSIPPEASSVPAKLTLWPRSEAIGQERKGSIRSVIPGNNFSPSYVVNGLECDQKGSKYSLEIVNTEKRTKKEINLAQSNKLNEAEKSIRQVPLISVAAIHSPETVETAKWSLAAVLDSQGCIRFFEMDDMAIDGSMRNWKQMMGVSEKRDTSTAFDKERGSEGESKPKFGVDKPKHGKEDEKNEPHVGGNTWAGGTGGSDTAGLGGRGGPYRLDKGHKIHQVSEADKQISAEAKARAAEMAKAALAQRMKDINMGKAEFESYERFRLSVQSQVTILRQILQELTSRSHERKWLKNQNQGEFDDSKLVDGLTGDRLVFKRRGVDPEVIDEAAASENLIKKRLQFVMDVSGSMYRFNSQDRRLERMLEAALMVMASIPNEDTIEYSITGHSGDTPNITFVPYHSKSVEEEKPRFQVLQKMVAHSQFCQAGDNTLESAEIAIKNMLEGYEKEKQYLRYLFVLSDANFERYGISSTDIRRLLNKDPRVQVHFIFIASLGDEADRLATSLPKERVHLCYESTDLPSIFKKILTSYGGAFDTN